MACSLSLAPLASFACWRGRSTAGPSHSDVPSQAHSARLPISTGTHREVLALMVRAEEKAGPEDVGEQALMRGLDTAFPFFRLGLSWSSVGLCYEAGPTGYGLYRLLKSLGHECLVVAPSLVPKKAGDRVKTNRRDAVSLAKLLRAGELTAVWVPDERHEAMRDLSRARQAVKKDLQRKPPQISSLMLRLGRIYPGKTTWGPAHMKWLMAQKLEHREQRITFEELLDGIRQESERVERLEKAIREAVPEWSLAEVVAALQAMRGIDLIAAVVVLAEIGDLSRFQNPRELMGYLGLVPSESSTGDKVKRGGITKAGNGRARRILVEAAWSYRYP